MRNLLKDNPPNIFIVEGVPNHMQVKFCLFPQLLISATMLSRLVGCNAM